MLNLRAQIRAKIDDLASAYRHAPGTILTEDDLKCLLVNRLLEIPDLRTQYPTQDPGVIGTMVHTEVSWFNRNWQLKKKPDVTILDPRALSIFHGSDGGTLPRKGFAFGGQAIIFELKLIRDKGGVGTRATQTIRNDLRKIEDLFNKLERDGAAGEVFCFFVIFSKVDRQAEEFDAFISQHAANDRYEFIYRTAAVAWPRKLGVTGRGDR